MITKLELKNFTTFEKLDIDFSPRINVIIGENGTGKTQLLKAGYALSHTLKIDSEDIETTFTKADYGTQEDCLTPNVCLTR
jgi:recombinational DNA repair ATPase RecF